MIVAFPGILGFPAEAGRPLGPNAMLFYKIERRGLDEEMEL